MSLAQSQVDPFNPESFAQKEAVQNQAAASNAQGPTHKKDSHLHETSIRVDPPFTADGKAAIKAAEKALEEAKVDYEKKKAKETEEELKF